MQHRFFWGCLPLLSSFLAMLCLFASARVEAVESPALAAFPALSLDQPHSPQAQAVRSYLQALVKKQGQVRLIVTLRTPAQAEHLLNAAQVQTQRGQVFSAQDAFLKRIAKLGGKPGRQFDTLPAVVVEANPATLEHILNQSSDVVGVQEDRLLKPFLAESVPLVGGSQAWAAGAGGAGQTVAVLDTGVDAAHPFLAGKVVAEACYSSTGSTQGVYFSSVCPGGLSARQGAGSAKPCTAKECIHGTHVAGIAAGKGSNFSGVARDSSIIAVQVFSHLTNVSQYCKQPPCALTFDSDVIKGLEYVYGQRDKFKIAAVNLSLGGGEYASHCDTHAAKPVIDNLRAAGIATVIASGNDGYTGALAAPACISTAISVGATSKADAVASFSNSAGILSLLAPGVDINSSVPNGGYQKLPGTSMAAPHVAGAWAVLKSQKATASVDEIGNALKTTGKLIADSRNGITKPRIQVDLALHSLGGGSPTSTTTSSSTTSSTTSSSTTVASTTTTTLAASCYRASNYAHVVAGRAYSKYGYVYANGSNQYLGWNSTFYTTTLKRTGNNYYVIGSCG